MRGRSIFALAAALAVSIGSAANADVYGPGPAGVIPDNSPAGVSSVINISGLHPSFQISDLNLTIHGLTHTWAGDLAATLSNGTTTVTFVSRVGRTSTTTGFGDSSDFGGDYTFDSDSANNINAAAAAAGAAVAIPPGTYWTSDSLTASVATPAGSVNNLAFNAYDGQNANGTWTLNVVDGAGGDTGGFTGWSLEIVPEPTSLALLALGGLAMFRRR